MLKICAHGTEVKLDAEQLVYSFKSGNNQWSFMKEKPACLHCEEGDFYFSDALCITHQKIRFGLGEAIQSHYEGFVVNGKTIPFTFDTFVWVESSTGDVYFEWIPVCEEGLTVKRMEWPGTMEFESAKDSWYTLINAQQGLMIPNTWPIEKGPVSFDGFFGASGAYMPWFGQVKDGAAYIAICCTPWNGGYYIQHPAHGPYTHTGFYFEPSLGKMDYRRILRYTFKDHCDHNDLCKIYRAYVKEQGLFRSLSEKAAKNPSVNELIGCAFVHKGIKTAVHPESDYFDPTDPEKNNHVTSFSQRNAEMRQLHQLGVEKLYLHLDGWAQPGYDNQHPDYYPACVEAGGWEGMRDLCTTMRECGYLFGIHDQYRDYYLSAESHDESFACHLPDGTVPFHKRWAGGPQNYLCATQAPYYVKRNFQRLSEHGIHLDCAYLDVFTCNEGDECASPAHRMTRRECYEYRNRCFEYLLSNNILSSSEEVSDWSVPSLVTCHYAPYDFMLRDPNAEKQGIPVPLFNLVYHDCLIVPWMLEKFTSGEDYMLYALLNGGAPYLLREDVGPEYGTNTVPFSIEEKISRSKIVSQLHEKVAKCELLRYDFVDGDTQIHRSTFSDGTVVTVNFRTQEYNIDIS